MMFIGYLYGIRSERQLEEEIKGNVYYRWFLGLGLKDKVPDHSTISFNRASPVCRIQPSFKIFLTKLSNRPKDTGWLEGRILFSDSTHLKANANKKKFTIEKESFLPAILSEELDQAVNQDREEHGKKP